MAGHIYIMTNIPDNEFLQPATLVIKATQYDNPDRYAVTTLTVTRGGIFDSDLQFLQRSYSVRILENAPLNRFCIRKYSTRTNSNKCAVVFKAK